MFGAGTTAENLRRSGAARLGNRHLSSQSLSCKLSSPLTTPIRGIQLEPEIQGDRPATLVSSAVLRFSELALYFATPMNNGRLSFLGRESYAPRLFERHGISLQRRRL